MAVDGYRLVYERKIKFDLHLIDPEVPDRVLEEVNRLEDMIVKILVRVSVQASNLLIDSNIGRRRQLFNSESRNIQSQRLLLPLRTFVRDRGLLLHEIETATDTRISGIPHHAHQTVQPDDYDSKDDEDPIVDE